MMCVRCRMINQPRARYCARCGATLPPPYTPPIVSRQCRRFGISPAIAALIGRIRQVMTS